MANLRNSISTQTVTTLLTAKLDLPDYGNMYMDLAESASPTGSALTTMSAVAGTYTGLIGVTIAGANLLNFSVTPGDAVDVVGRLTYTGATTKKFRVSWSYSATTSESTFIYGFGILKSGTRDATFGHSVNKGSANHFCGSGSAIVTLAQNEYLQLAGTSSGTTGTNTVRTHALHITAEAVSNS